MTDAEQLRRLEDRLPTRLALLNSIQLAWKCFAPEVDNALANTD